MKTSLVALSLLGFAGCVTAGSEDSSFLSEIGKADTAAGGTFVRFAHLAKAPAGDFCFAPRGSSNFIGPVLRMLGLRDGVEPSQVTRYFAAPPGAYDLRVVPGGFDSCDRVLGLPDVTDLPSLSPGSRITIAALGEFGPAAQPLTLRAVIDEAADHPDSVKVRFVHAAVGAPALDVLARFGSSYFPVFTGVDFGKTGAGNASGYFVTAPMRVPVALRPTGSNQDLLTLPDLDLPAGRSLTAYAVQTTSLRLLVCEDASVDAPAACHLEPAP